MRQAFLSILGIVLLCGSAQAQVKSGVEKYFERLGYSLCFVDLVHKDGNDDLVVVEGTSELGSTSFTSDLPLMFDRLMFQRGYYSCKKGVSGGITEMIDQDGATQDFSFAEWKSMD